MGQPVAFFQIMSPGVPALPEYPSLPPDGRPT